MSKRTAYFADGTIIENDGGRSHWKRVVSDFTHYCGRVWFRPCEEWRKAMREVRENG